MLLDSWVPFLTLLKQSTPFPPHLHVHGAGAGNADGWVNINESIKAPFVLASDHHGLLTAHGFRLRLMRSVMSQNVPDFGTEHWWSRTHCHSTSRKFLRQHKTRLRCILDIERSRNQREGSEFFLGKWNS